MLLYTVKNKKTKNLGVIAMADNSHAIERCVFELVEGLPLNERKRLSNTLDVVIVGEYDVKKGIYSTKMKKVCSFADIVAKVSKQK